MVLRLARYKSVVSKPTEGQLKSVDGNLGQSTFNCVLERAVLEIEMCSVCYLLVDKQC